jgi:hypothetical protein
MVIPDQTVITSHRRHLHSTSPACMPMALSPWRCHRSKWGVQADQRSIQDRNNGGTMDVKPGLTRRNSLDSRLVLDQEPTRRVPLPVILSTYRLQPLHRLRECRGPGEMQCNQLAGRKEAKILLLGPGNFLLMLLRVDWKGVAGSASCLQPIIPVDGLR